MLPVRGEAGVAAPLDMATRLRWLRVLPGTGNRREGCLIRAVRSRGSEAYGGAAAFEEDDVSPAVVVAAEVVAGADDAEAGLFVEAEAGGVLGEDA
jgi:hypothetical protein